MPPEHAILDACPCSLTERPGAEVCSPCDRDNLLDYHLGRSVSARSLDDPPAGYVPVAAPLTGGDAARRWAPRAGGAVTGLVHLRRERARRPRSAPQTARSPGQT